MTASEYTNKFREILGVSAGSNEVDIPLSVNTVDEAKIAILKLRNYELQLRALRKDLSYEIRSVRAAYADKRAQIGNNLGSALLAGFFGRRNAGRTNVLERNSLRQEQSSTIAPYEQVQRDIDKLLNLLSSRKVAIQSWMRNPT